MDLHLLDLSSIAHPIWYQVGSDTTNPNATCEKTLARVRALASGKPHFAVCADSGRSFRRDLNPEYKANRPVQAAALTHQLRMIEDACRADGFPVWAAAGYEADDIIATAVRIAREVKDPALRVTVLSADKDLLQLVTDGVLFDGALTPDPSGSVVVYRTHMGGELFDRGRTLIEFGVYPEQIRDYLTLVGDATDNIKGAKDVGKKKAADLLAAFGTIEGIYTALTHEGTKFTPALATNLRAFESRADDVRALVTLRTDAPIAFAEVAAERVAPELPAPAGWSANTTGTAATLEGLAENVVTETVTPEARSEMSDTYQDVTQAIQNEAARVDPRVEEAKSVAAEVMTTLSPAVGAGAAQAVGQMGVQALAPRAATLVTTTFERQLEPRDYFQARELAADLFASRLFAAYGTAPAVLSTVLAGRELGMQAMASLRAFHIVDNKPTMAADAMRALVLKSGKAKYFRCVERKPDTCTFETLRDGDSEPTRLTYTLVEARAAWGKSDQAWAASGWGKYSSDMLVARASAKLCRLVYSDVTFGLYDPNEIEA